MIDSGLSGKSFEPPQRVTMDQGDQDQTGYTDDEGVAKMDTGFFRIVAPAPTGAVGEFVASVAENAALKAHNMK